MEQPTDQLPSEEIAGSFFDFAQLEQMKEFFHNGGTVMYFILILFIIGTSIIIERLYMILFVYEENAAGLMQKVQRLILENNLEEAVKLTNRKKQAAIYQVFKAALMNADRPAEEIRDHIEVAMLSVVPKLHRRMPYLFTISNVATLLGLLGTISGLIKTFASIGAVNASEKQALLAGGISEAMSATAFGLVVAIPTMFVYGFLFNRINSIIDDCEYYSARLLMLLRTGSEYFDHFSSDALLSTEQTPLKRPSSSRDKSLKNRLMFSRKKKSPDSVDEDGEEAAPKKALARSPLQRQAASTSHRPSRPAPSSSGSSSRSSMRRNSAPLQKSDLDDEDMNNASLHDRLDMDDQDRNSQDHSVATETDEDVMESREATAASPQETFSNINHDRTVFMPGAVDSDSDEDDDDDEEDVKPPRKNRKSGSHDAA